MREWAGYRPTSVQCMRVPGKGADELHSCIPGVEEGRIRRARGGMRGEGIFNLFSGMLQCYIVLLAPPN